MINAQYPVLIVIIPLFTALLIPVIGYLNKKICYYLAVAAIGMTTIFSVSILNTVITQGTIHYRVGGWMPPWGIEYAVDQLSAFMIIIIAFISLNGVVYSQKSVEMELPEKVVPFYSLLLLLYTGLLGILATGDLFNLYVFLEVASLTAYGLIGLGEKGAWLSSFRYLILGTIGACLYLLGVACVYLITGSLNMADVSDRLPDLYSSKVVLIAFCFFILGIGVKVALFPMHSWLPDAYTHAPSSVSAFIAPTMTKVAAYMMIRVMYTIFEPDFAIEAVPMTTILAWMSAVAIIIGSIYAIRQTDLKRMLAYSSVAQVGYIVMGIGLANRAGLTGGLLHILNHAFMKGCLFMVAGALMYRLGHRNIFQLKGLYRRMPFTMIAFTITAFSMIGIPPTCGFFSKLYLILGMIDARQWFFVVVILLSSLLNVVYFSNVIKNIYFADPEEETMAITGSGKMNLEEITEVPMTMRIPIILIATGILLLGIYNGTIVSNVIQNIIPSSF